jgi:hypothetical protein
MNHKTFFMNTLSEVFARATNSVVLYEITFDKLLSYSGESSLFEKKLIAH